MSELKETLSTLKTLSKAARKGPWGKGGQVVKHKGKAVSLYKLDQPEEDLIIFMRNHIDSLVAELEKRL